MYVAGEWVPKPDNNFMLPFINLKVIKFGLGEYWLQTQLQQNGSSCNWTREEFNPKIPTRL